MAHLCLEVNAGPALSESPQAATDMELLEDSDTARAPHNRLVDHRGAQGGAQGVCGSRRGTRAKLGAGVAMDVRSSRTFETR